MLVGNYFREKIMITENLIRESISRKDFFMRRILRDYTLNTQLSDDIVQQIMLFELKVA